MGLNEIIAKVSDPYDRQARLWPALLAVFPLIATLSILYGPELSALSNTTMLAVSCGGLFLMINVSRDLGKRLEERLFKRWGGKPTTQLLRHRDKIIEGVTKQRYHQFLSSKINVPFPDVQQEAGDPASADEIYQSSIRWLINQTRDVKKFSLLFRENVAYGFRRNALGAKPIGVTICIVSIALLLVNQGIIGFTPGININTEALRGISEKGVVSLATALIMLSLWCCYFTASSVRVASFTYAETLLRACDELVKK